MLIRSFIVLPMDTTRILDVARARSLAESGEARALREANRLSLREVAEALGVAPSTVYCWETGRKVPRGGNAVAYKRLLMALAAGAGRSFGEQ